MSVFSTEVFLAILGIAVVLVSVFFPKIPSRTLAWVGIAGVLLSLGCLLGAAAGSSPVPSFVVPYYSLDSLSLFYKGFALVITALVLWLITESEKTLSSFSLDGRIGELVGLPLIVCTGMMWIASAKDLVTVFAALELVTVSFYVLVAYTRKSALTLEAGVKYLILGAAATGVLVYGIAWIYGSTGSLTFEGIAGAMRNPTVSKPALMFGIVLLLAGLGFKVAAAPFHMWVPDVYQGAPTAVTAFLSVGSKASGFIVLTRLVDSLLVSGTGVSFEVVNLLLVSAAITLILGSLPAIFQTSIKRLLAYSSISHAGFLLLALACRGSTRFNLAPGDIVAFYLGSYLPMTVLAFFVLVVIRRSGRGDSLEDLRGLSRSSPLLALLMTVAMASLAGVPLTVGFLGKMMVFMTAVDHGYWGVIGCAVLSAAAGFFYYFRVILAVYSGDNSQTYEPIRLALPTRVIAVSLAVVVVIAGVYPRPIQRAITASPTTAQAK
jgi:NADH-quinone oxidoreductase subunit N